MSSQVVVGWRQPQCLQESSERRGKASQPAQLAAILEDQDRQAGELLDQGTSREGKLGALEQEFEEGKDQESHHGAEHQCLNPLLFMEVDGTNGQWPLDQGIPFLRHRALPPAVGARVVWRA